jgi:anti-anti-sigma regulatory factor
MRKGKEMVQIDIDYIFEKMGNVGLYYLRGDLSSDREDGLKVLLMRALHGTDRAVINLRNVSYIDERCMRLLRLAYKISLRLRKPIIITEIPENYIEEIFDHGTERSEEAYQLLND